MATSAAALLASMALFQGADARSFSLLRSCDWPEGRGAIPLVAQAYSSTYSPQDLAADLGKPHSSTGIEAEHVVAYDRHGKGHVAHLQALQYYSTTTPWGARYEMKGPYDARRSIGVFLEIGDELGLVDCFAATEFNFIDVRSSRGGRCEAPVDVATKRICNVARQRGEKLIGARFTVLSQTVAADTAQDEPDTTTPQPRKTQERQVELKKTTTVVDTNPTDDLALELNSTKAEEKPSRRPQQKPKQASTSTSSSADKNEGVTRKTSSYVSINSGGGKIVGSVQQGEVVHLFQAANSFTGTFSSNSSG